MSSVSAANTRSRGRSCLVTGAAGFLGQQLVPRLVEAGVKVTALVRTGGAFPSGVATLTQDMSGPDWPRSMRSDWRWDDVVHLAGVVPHGAGGFVAEARAARLHVLLALALRSALPAGWAGRLIHASSMTVYGAAPRLPVLENQTLEPRFPYALGKVLAEDVWRLASLSDYWLLRLPGLFSAQRQSGALYHFVRAGLEARPIRVTAPEPTLWDILHVDDAAEAIVRALASDAPFQGAMNVSHGEVVELEQVGRRISELTTRVDVINEARVIHPTFQLDIALARGRIGWPPCSLDQRLSELVRDVRKARG